MHIVVCVKQIPNPEAAFSMLKVDEQAKKVVPAPGLQLVMSPFDEQALEAALQIRESAGATKITALTVGPESARNILKHALAMGADEAILVSDPLLEDAGSEATAYALSCAVRQLGPVQLVLAGRQAADWDAGAVGCGVAELLGFPVITFARKIERTGDRLIVERVLNDGFEVLESDLPALVTVSNELGAPRKPNLRETMRAARKPLALKSARDVDIDAAHVQRLGGLRVRERLYVPVKSGRCEILAGATETEQAAELVRRLQEARLV